MISQIYQKLKKLDDLSPNPEVNGLFSELVEYVLTFNNLEPEEAEKHIKGMVNDGEITELQVICGLGEAALERYWAREIIEHSQELTSFPYYQNYVDLTKLEMSLLDQEDRDWCDFPVLFIGGGSLPMTAIMLAYSGGIKSTIVDIDAEAIRLAEQVISQLGLSHLISVQSSDGANFSDYKNYKTIYVAALAGLGDKPKQLIFQQIAAQVSGQQLLVARSSWGARQVLYRQLPDLSEFGLKQVLKFDPRDGIVNSVVILRKKENES